MLDQATCAQGQLLLAPDTNIRCPDCAQEFSLERGFASKALEHLAEHSRGLLSAIETQVSHEAEQRVASQARARAHTDAQQIERLEQLLQQQNSAHAKALAEVRSLTEQGFAPQLQVLRAELAQSQTQLRGWSERESALNTRERELEQRINEAARARAEALFAADRGVFEQQLNEASAQLAQMRAQELQLRQAQRTLEERSAQQELELSRRLDTARHEIEGQVRAQEKERSEFERAELQKKLDDVNDKLREAQQKSSQSSQQLQGEVFELALEEQLRQAFPMDTLEEVKKGARGADIVQRVTTRTLQVAGTMLWEAKRAKDWGRDWPAKLKEDMRAAGADIGILVTTSLPPTLPATQGFGLHEDVWVSCWSVAMPLAAVLRERVLEVHKQRTVAAGKGEKMEALYDYLTSAQFAQKLKAVFGTFRQMHEDLQKERSVAEQRWARREKQIVVGMKELLGFAGDVQGLAQQDLPQLELTPDELELQ